MRLQELASFVSTNPGCDADALAAHFEVSTRTVRTYVRKFNEAFDGSAELSFRRSSGYSLSVNDKDAYEALKSRMETLIEAGMPANSDQRIAYLLDDLLSRTSWVRLDDLAQALFVSRRTVTKDMRGVVDRLHEFGLELEERPRYGVRVTGPEAARRSCWIDSASRSTDLRLNGDSLHELGELSECVSSIVDETLGETGRGLATISRNSLILHIVIAVIRARLGAYIPLGEDDARRLCDEGSLELAEILSRRVERAFDVSLPSGEVAYIAIHLSGGRLTTVSEAAGDEVTDFAIGEDVWNTVSVMLETVRDVFAFDFSGDIELRMNLCRHIAPLGVRLSYRMALKNPLLDEIKYRYPLAYAMAADSSSVLARRYGNEPSDDEVGYIALAFALALERMHEEAPRKRVLLVCASGAGTSRLLAYRFKGAFGPLLESVETCDVRSVASRDFSNIDYVFTTVPIPVQLPVPVQQISSFLDEDDITGVHRALNARPSLDTALAFFERELFFDHLRFGTRDEVIHFLGCQVVGRYGAAVGEDFVNSVIAREEAFSTAFGNMVAIPHPSEALSSVTVACVGLLDEPVEWDSRGNRVRVVILMAFSKDDTDGLKDLMSLLAELLTDPDLVSGLLASQGWEYFARLLEDSNNKGKD